MKTRLPKALLLAILAAGAYSFAEDVQTTIETDKNIELTKYYPTGEPTTDNKQLPSGSVYTYEDATNLTLKGDAKLGVFENGSFVADYFSSSQVILSRPGTKFIFGQPVDYSDTYSDKKSNAVISPNFKVNGTLSITENARVVLGGQYRLEKGGSGEYDEYTGLIADKVIVNGNKGVHSLDVTNLSVNTLEVKAGKVTIHNDVQSGNDYFYIPENKEIPTYDCKQVRIKSALNVDGGSVHINLNQLDKDNKNLPTDKCTYTGFGDIEFTNLRYEGGFLTGRYVADDAKVTSSWINQTAGDLVIQGKTASVGGLNIDQSGGTAKISEDSWHILSDYGDSTIIQSNNADLVIGGIAAQNSNFNRIVEVLDDVGVVYDPTTGVVGKEGRKMEINPSISIEQTGSGTINIVKGIDFTSKINESTETSSIVQSGSGTIKLNGAYEGVKFDVTQSGFGTIELNSDISAGAVVLTDDDVTAADTATPGAEKGGLVVASGKTLTAESITIDGGKLVNNGTVNGNITIGAVAETFSVRSTEVDVVTGELKNSGTINGDVLVQGGTLIADSGSKFLGKVEVEGGTLEVDADATMSAGLKMDDASTLIFAEGTTIDLGTSDLELADGVEIAVTLTDADIENLSGVTLFTSADEKDADWGSYEVAVLDSTGKDTGKKAVLNYNAGGDVTLESVPEPTTATLSLLALAALASRRRRK